MAGETKRHQPLDIGGPLLGAPEFASAAAQDEPVLYGPEDFRTGMPPRIMGDELELRPSAGILVDRMEPPVFQAAGLDAYRADSAVVQVWFDNGASLKDEAGQHIEGRTAESLGPRDAAISMRALLVMTQTLMALTYKVNLPIQTNSRPPTLHNHAASYDHRRNIRRGNGEYALERRGYHLSLMSPLPREGDRLTIDELLEAHTVTSPWAGAGLLTAEGFRLVQKDKATSFSASTARKNTGMVAIHYPDHEDNDSVPDGFVRVERRMGDALRSTIADFAQKAAASLVLRVVEHQHVLTPGYIDELLGSLPKDKRQTFILVSGDLTLKKTILCNDGRERTWRNIQEVLHGAAKLVLEKSDSTQPDELQGLDLWEQLVEIMAHSNPSKGEVDEASGYLHWAARMRLLQRHTDLPPGMWNAAEQTDLNLRSLASDLVFPLDHMARYAEHTAAGIMTEEEVARRVYEAPHTRAAARGGLIRRHNDPDDSFKIKALCWRFAQKSSGKKIHLNPFDPRTPNT